MSGVPSFASDLNAANHFHCARNLAVHRARKKTLLFNVIAGAAAIPQDLRYTTALLHLSRLDRWRTLLLPALFPYLITGAISAGGGAWNASIVAEYVQFGGQVHTTTGIGALITEATHRGNYAMLLAATLTMVVAVVLISRTFWRRLYRLAEERYRLE